MVVGKVFTYVFMIANVVIFIAGIVVIGVGALKQKDFNQFTEVFGKDSSVDEYTTFFGGGVIAGGCFLIGLGVLGMLGGYFKGKCCLIIYNIVLAIWLIVFIFVGGAAIIVSNGTVNTTPWKEKMQMSMSGYRFNKSQSQWDDLQTKFKCCGADNDNGTMEWIYLQNFVPSSCCKKPSLCPSSPPPIDFDSDKLPKNFDIKKGFDYKNGESFQDFFMFEPPFNATGDYWNEGCFDKFLSLTRSIGNVAIAIAVIMLILIVLAYIVMCIG